MVDAPGPAGTTGVAARGRIDRWFELTARGSSYGREIRGGIVTFITMAYIVVLNPLVLGTAKDVNGDFIGGAASSAQAIAMLTAATALVAGLMTVLMGAVGRFPMGVAAGLGLNGFVAYTLAPQMTWAEAMGLVVLEGVIVLILVLTGMRTAVFHAMPDQLKYAITVGIGLFITIIALVNAGFVRPGTPVLTMGVDGYLRGWPIGVFVAGLLLSVALVVRKVPGALLIGIAVTTVLALAVQAVARDGHVTEDNPTGWALNVPEVPSQLVAAPDLSLLGQFSLFGAFQAVGFIAATLAVFSLVLSDFFDTMGTAFGLANEGDLLDENGDVPHFEPILVVDAAAAMAGGAASVSSNTSYIDSATGIGEGARTGIASLVTGGLFLLAMFFSPLVAIIPNEAATPALVIVGFMMMTQVRHIDFGDYTIGIPAFLLIVMIPFTYSIANGLGAGMIAYVFIQVVTGRARQVHGLMWAMAAMFVVYFLVYPIEELFGLTA